MSGTGTMRSLLSSAAHQLEELAESLENACEDFEGPEDEDPPGH